MLGVNRPVVLDKEALKYNAMPGTYKIVEEPKKRGMFV
jgi:hypothetical protein